ERRRARGGGAGAGDPRGRRPRRRAPAAAGRARDHRPRARRRPLPRRRHRLPRARDHRAGARRLLPPRPGVPERHVRQPHQGHPPPPRRRRRGAGRQVQADVPGALTMAKVDISREGKPLTIGAVCRILQEEFDDVSISKIRFLEDQNLVTPRRTPGGYRLYGPAEVDRLREVLRLQRDEFLPLRVIRQELQNGPLDRSERPGRRRTATLVDDRRRLSRDELIVEAGADEAFVRELEDFGLIVPSGPDRTYGDADADVV